MNSIRIFSLFIFLFFGGSLFGQSSNLIKSNSGFENLANPVKGWDISLEKEGSAPSCAYSKIVANGSRSGKNCLLFFPDKTTKKACVVFGQKLEWSKKIRGDYTFSAWVKADLRKSAKVPIEIGLKYFKKNGQLVSEFQKTFLVGNEWTKISAATPASHRDSFLQIYIRLKSVADESVFGRIWIDDLCLCQSEDGYKRGIEGKQITQLGIPPKGSKSMFLGLPMRDGVKLQTFVYVPPGKGPFPVILRRSIYIFKPPGSGGFATVGQRLYRGEAPELRPDYDPLSYDNEIDDTYDTCAWIMKQPWCNGRIGVVGNSGSGIGATMAPYAAAPGVVAVSPDASGSEARLYWGSINGVRRNTIYRWMGRRGVNTAKWPCPTVYSFDEKAYRERTKKLAANGSFKGLFLHRSGWYDLYTESLLDAFNDFKDHALCVMDIGFHAHGGCKGKSWNTIQFPKRNVGFDRRQLFRDALRGVKSSSLPEKSTIYYYILGDVKDEKAPGNIYKTTTCWPPANCAPANYYFHKNGLLSTGKPTAPAAKLSYVYDPKNPVRTFGGATFGMSPGPADQRPLSTRKDILRFETSPLKEPLALTGPITATLYISSDVKDTLFTVKLIDVYPDGYEMILQDAPFMTRFRNGRDKETPLEPGRITELRIPVWSVANVFNVGHKIAVHISSSNSPRFEVHPNTWKKAKNINEAKIANQNLYLSQEYPSHITLPVVPVPVLEKE